MYPWVTEECKHPATLLNLSSCSVSHRFEIMGAHRGPSLVFLLSYSFLEATHCRLRLSPLLWEQTSNVISHSLQQKCNPSGTRWLKTEVTGQHKEQREGAQACDAHRVIWGCLKGPQRSLLLANTGQMLTSRFVQDYTSADVCWFIHTLLLFVQIYVF